MTPAKGYTEMKDSGIEWIGAIPAHWDILRGKNVLRLLERPVKPEDDVVTCFRDGEVTLRKNRREEGFTNSLKEIGYQGIEPGDLIVHGMDGFAGAIGISDSRGKASPVLNVMDSNQNKRYLMYYLRAMAYKDVFMALSTGIRVRSCDLRWNKLSVFPFLIPKSHEQSAIAAYLDTQCAKIDEIIAQAKASIEDYKQWKASIIYEAVTKGLDPNVEMKDSGIEWIGKIPKQWGTKQIRYLFELRDERNDLPLEQVNLISLYTDLGVVQHSDLEKITGNKAVTADGYKQVYPNDIVVNIILCWMGAIGMSNYAGVTSPAYDVYKPKDSQVTLSKYYHYLFRTARFNGKCYTVGRGIMAMRWRTYSSEFRAIKVPVPSYKTQVQIVEYLDSVCSKIDDLISEKQSLIDNLESYKKSLIYEVVTGKRQIR